MKERYRRMMGQINLSEQAKTELLEKLEEKSPAAKRSSVLRTALIAACACLVLAGGAFAAEHLAGVWLGQVESGEDHSTYYVQADFGQWKLEAMGQQLQEDLEQGVLRRTFDDKTELEEYMGVKLAVSKALEQAGIVEDLSESLEWGWNLRPELTVDTTARYVLTGMALDGTEMPEDPHVLKVTTHRVVDNFEVYVDARIVTEKADPEQLEQGLMGEFFDAVHLLDWNVSFDEEGNPVYETIQYTSAEKKITSEPYVMANGVEATIVTVETVERWIERQKESGLPFEGNGACEYIGYFIHEGVLYSVRAYAIYDPMVECNYGNGSSRELAVLKTVLDSFE